MPNTPPDHVSMMKDGKRADVHTSETDLWEAQGWGYWKGAPDRAEVDIPEPPAAVIDIVTNNHPLDRDGDGQPGGSLPADQRGDEAEVLRAEYEALNGSAPDRRWGVPRLKKEIEKAKG